ncbi:MAG: hypothetical protein MK105_11480 [Crocinitomicaceae bacterium]|nr:hypothetical protein [Crocinitomicaceae bacterium]
MKAKIYLTAMFLTLCVGDFWAQENKMFTDEQFLSIESLEPEDKTPMVYNSQKEMDELREHRIQDAKKLILQGILSEEQIVVLRERIWRLENAVIREELDK